MILLLCTVGMYTVATIFIMVLISLLANELVVAMSIPVDCDSLQATLKWSLQRMCMSINIIAGINKIWQASTLMLILLVYQVYVCILTIGNSLPCIVYSYRPSI